LIDLVDNNCNNRYLTSRGINHTHGGRVGLMRSLGVWLMTLLAATNAHAQFLGPDWPSGLPESCSLPATPLPPAAILADVASGLSTQPAAAASPQPAGTPAIAPSPAAAATPAKTEEPKRPETPPPFPALPPGYGMGGYAQSVADLPRVESFEDVNRVLRDALSVRLRKGGIVQPYGFFRVDYDTATQRFNQEIDNPFFVISPDPRNRVGPAQVPPRQQDVIYMLTPRLTRVGLEYFGPAIALLDNATVSGRVETDFLTLNPGGSESRELLRLRLAYLAIKHGPFTLVAGQDWDIAGPLLPLVNDNTNFFNAGNTGDRRPCVKFLVDHDLGKERILQVQNAIVLGDAINSQDLDGDGLRDQENSGIPAYQARLGVSLPTGLPNQPVFAGIWGMLAIDQVNQAIAGRNEFRSRGIGVDLRFPITQHLVIHGEAFYGRNLDDFRGGIAQGINPVTGVTIETHGAWAELVYNPVPWYVLAVGGSFDNPTNSTVPEQGRTLNYVGWVGNRFPVGNGVTFGADYYYWSTEYKGLQRGQANLVKLFLAAAF
jgi:hypothetical protein